jgi:hypothetical protein
LVHLFQNGLLFFWLSGDIRFYTSIGFHVTILPYQLVNLN